MTIWKSILLFLCWPLIAALLLVGCVGLLICLWPLTLNRTFVGAFLAAQTRAKNA